MKSVARKMCIAFIGIGEMFSADIKVVVFCQFVVFSFSTSYSLGFCGG